MSRRILMVMLIALLAMTGPHAAQAELIDYRNAVLADAPVGYWTLDETSGSVAADISGNALDGTYLGGVTLGQSAGFGPGNFAAQFDGTSGYVNVPDTGAGNPLDLSAGVTMEAWINWAGPGGEASDIIWNKENVYEGAVQGGTQVQAAIRPNWAWNNAAPFNTNEWTHVAVTWDQDLQTVYINGAPVSIDDLTDGPINVINNDDFRIGARGGDAAATSFFSGLIDEVAIYGVPLSGEQILAHYDAAFFIFDPNAVPEPSTGVLLVLGTLAMARHARRRRKLSQSAVTA